MTTPARPVTVLRAHLGDAVQENVSLAPHTSARIGGAADILITVKTSDQLAEAVRQVRAQKLPLYILGGGSNVLISDKGIRGAVILNRAKAIQFHHGEQPSVWCESGVVFSNLANRCASKGLSGLEWAATVPGTIGGAVYGNAGAFGGNMAGNLCWAELLIDNKRERFSVEQMQYDYRASVLKNKKLNAAVLSAELILKNSTKEDVTAKIEQFSERRKTTQPPGASMGSMFKNPVSDYAGRLIEAAGLKGTRIGNAEISPLHGNFFINHGKTNAADIRALIELTQKTVKEKCGVDLELEIELVGDW